MNLYPAILPDYASLNNLNIVVGGKASGKTTMLYEYMKFVDAYYCCVYQRPGISVRYTNTGLPYKAWCEKYHRTMPNILNTERCLDLVYELAAETKEICLKYLSIIDSCKEKCVMFDEVYSLKSQDIPIIIKLIHKLAETKQKKVFFVCSGLEFLDAENVYGSLLVCRKRENGFVVIHSDF